MKLELFEVLHIPKPHKVDLPSLFVVETCQRSVVFGSHLPSLPGVERLRGLEAYEWALRFTTGLLSRIPGEPDVFGQFRAQWAEYGGEKSVLHPWVTALHEDTKWVRSQFLQSLGQQSYGQGFRMWRTKKHLIGKLGVIVGAGDLAESCLATVLASESLHVWNRGKTRLKALEEKWSQKKPHVRFFSGEASWKEAIQDAGWALLAVPADQERFESLKQGSKVGPVLNLGSFSTWGNEEVCSLDGFFGMKARLAVDAARKIQRAERACRERALLRHLDRHVGLAHGWEDLAGFPALDALM